MTDLIEDTLTRFRERMEELRPLIEEHKQLEAAVAALVAVNGTATPPKRSAKRRVSAQTRGRTRGRRRGSGRRADQILALVMEKPGITIPAMAGALDISPNYLYRVTARLTEERKIVKDGQGWHPAGVQQPSASDAQAGQSGKRGRVTGRASKARAQTTNGKAGKRRPTRATQAGGRAAAKRAKTSGARADG